MAGVYLRQYPELKTFVGDDMVTRVAAGLPVSSTLADGQQKEMVWTHLDYEENADGSFKSESTFIPWGLKTVV